MTPESVRTGRTADHLDGLDLAGRLLLSTDGTVTRLLEQIVGEPIETAGLVQQEVTADVDTALFESWGEDATLIHRRTRLVGARSGVVYIEAGTVIALDALPPALRDDLMTTTISIGRLLRLHRAESFRDILSCQVIGDDPGQARFRATRRYLIFIAGRPAMLVSESFTTDCFGGGSS